MARRFYDTVTSTVTSVLINNSIHRKLEGTIKREHTPKLVFTLCWRIYCHTTIIGLTWGHFSDGDNEVLFIVQ